MYFRCASLVLLASVLVVSGCATPNRGFGDNYRPIVDMHGVDQVRYAQDLNDCQNYASQERGAGESAVAGAVAGALVGALIQAASGSRYSRNRGAAVGGVVGGLAGAGEGETSQRGIVTRCLSLRGYRVLK